MSVIFLQPIWVISFSLCCVFVISVVLKPKLVRLSRAFVMCLLGLFWAMGCMPAFSKKGLYFAMTATVSMLGVGVWGRVCLTSFVPNPMLRYFGWITMRLMVLISCWSCFMLPFQTLLRAKQIGGG